MFIVGNQSDRARTHSAVPVNIDAIPSTLRGSRRWVVWSYGPARSNGKRPKVPHHAPSGRLASVRDSAHWCDFGEVVDAFSSGRYDGLGYVFADDGLAGVDLDNCRDPETGILAPAAQRIVAEFGTYTEVSPSGRGVKLFASGEIDPNGRNKKGDVEVYGSGRFFTVTGQHVPGTPHEVQPAGECLCSLQDLLGGGATTTPPKERGGADTAPDERVGTGFRGTDDELLKRAFAAQNGAQIAAYYLSADPCGKPSLSEALLGLAQLLAFWTGRDPDRLERLVCSSQLYLRAESERVKWFSRRGPDSWGMRYVVLKAIGTCAAFYSCSPLASPLPTEQRPNRVSSGRGFDFVKELLERVDARPLPGFIVDAVTSRKRAGQLAQQRLAALCLALDQHNGGGFHLSSVQAGKLIGVDQTTVSAWLTKFRTLRLIRRTQKGNGIGGVANCYVWTGPRS